jgi:hypothetical protein
VVEMQMKDSLEKLDRFDRSFERAGSLFTVVTLLRRVLNGSSNLLFFFRVVGAAHSPQGDPFFFPLEEWKLKVELDPC